MGIELVSVFMIAVGLSMDAFAVSVSSGMSISKVKLQDALRVGLFFGVAQGVMPIIGFFIGRTFSDYVGASAPWIALVLLVFIGGKMIFEALKQDQTESIKDALCTKTLFFLAIATSIDALAVGVTFALEGSEIFLSATIIAVTTLVISAIGVYLGKGVGRLLSSKAEIFGGIVLILIGVKIILEYFGVINL